MENNSARTFHSGTWSSVVALSIGLVFVNVWPDLSGHSPAFLTSGASVEGSINARVLFSVGMGACAFLYACFPRKIARKGLGVLSLVVAFSVAVTAVYSAVPFIPLSMDQTTAISFVCSFGIGFGHGWLLVQLLCLLAQRKSFTAIVGACCVVLLVKTALDSLLAISPAMLQVGAAVLSPLVIAISLWFTPRMADDPEQAFDLAELPKCDTEQTKMLLVILIVNAVLHAVTRSLSNLGFWGEPFSSQSGISPAFILVSLLLALMVYFTLVRNETSSMLTRFLPAFLLLLAGFFVLDPQVVGFLEMPSWLTESLSTVFELFAHTLYWVIIITAIRSLEMHPYRIVGITVSAMCLTSAFLAVFLQQIDEMNRFVVMVSMYSFVVIVVLLFKGSKEGSTMSLSENAVEKSIMERYKTIALEYGLSPRETEVFILLAQGRDRAFIQKELFISDATIKTHTQHIYVKLGVSNKQELISFVLDKANIC